MKFDFVVLGATGLQGKIVSKDLLEKGYTVLLCGRNKQRLDYILKSYKKARFHYFDAAHVTEMTKMITKSKADVVVNCVEGDWNLHILKACLRSNVNSLDLGASDGTMTKDQFKLDKALKAKGLIHITGCGSVPGIGNIMLRYAAEKFDTLHKIDVGYAWNSNIKQFVVPFSMPSIIEEFTDPATNIEQGKIVKSIPLDSLDTYNDAFVGKQKMFYVRHPEPYTFYHYYKDKGLQKVHFLAEFPPHSFDKINTLIELGFGSYEEINVNGVKIIPNDVTNEILKNIKPPQGYAEKEDLFVKIEGKAGSKKKTILMQCKVPTLKGWEDAGCNIDTGLPASIIAQMVKKGVITEKGSFAPEGVVPPEPFFEELRKREMVVYENGKRIN
ncbi:MAG: saccharopine dehydrogenase C-terminal domain-containing protein [Nanoarchaeota archaeon]|nr:saccharopine dehydrogenase C-terminal domain-containing protein [Nanoarchaeota archaeon]